jgi:hypothetical protein
MARKLRRPWFWWRYRIGSPFSRINRLDLWRPLDYPMGPPVDHERQRDQVRRLVAELAPGAVDEGTGEVLHNLINAWVDQAVAQIEVDHRDHQEFVGVLIGATAEELAKRRPQYEADLVEVERTARMVADLGVRLSGRPDPEGDR